MTPDKLRKHIIARRKALGWTQKDLAKQAYVSKNTLERYEGGHGELQLTTLLCVLDALGLEIYVDVKVVE